MIRHARSAANAAKLQESRIKAELTSVVNKTEVETTTFSVPEVDPEVVQVASVFSVEPIIEEGIVLDEAEAQEIEIEEIKENTGFNSFKKYKKS
jgi:hypothetical protein